ncbi:antiparallel microtubule cross-linking factor Ase1 [Schizosaccharomyces cryophilus OY26]|uniref:Antiparallel microtubule cross-linking factor Ase1 n=1 Tax=Schizosaccharomyces cryophilus (strain OY26 / ATCC MYA-4695 / CBS 11777 / NBRC 106824 / NRRL Y48691) TaxID=653667 RepID=S9VYR2_SCHCR|nr:antiparallel microtubule cross-linking factor Ase1 [Schizosaccharomyces cryophilus OY26]EPY52798.1 antiparallel microtubule cross-linking factor Ase1 [Schizosaccharomyces cryophilus OY26]
MDIENSQDNVAEEPYLNENDKNYTWTNFREQVENHFERIEILHQVLGTDGDNSSLFELFTTAMNAQLHEMEQCRKNLENDCRQKIDTIQFLASSLKLDDPDVDLQINPPLIQCLDELTHLESQYMAQYDKKVSTIKVLYQQLEQTCKQLGTPFAIPDFENAFLSDVSDVFLDSLRLRNEEARKELDSRLELVNNLESEIIQLWMEIGVESIDEPSFQELKNTHMNRPPQFCVPQLLITKLYEQKDMLVNMKEKCVMQINAFRDEVHDLWEKLNINAADYAHLEQSSGVYREDLAKWETQLQNLQELKKQHIPVFIEDARGKIKKAWDVLFYTDEQRRSFSPAFEENLTEDSLSAHEQYLKFLENEARENKHFLNLIAKYSSLLEGKRELEASANDSSRLMQRGRREPGLLLREEKIRKRLSRDLPKVQALLIPEISSWEEKNQRPFMFEGEHLLQKLKEPPQTRSNVRTNNTYSSKAPTTPSQTTNKSPQKGRIAALSTPTSRNNHRPMASPKTPLTRQKANEFGAARSVSADEPRTTAFSNRRLPAAGRLDLNNKFSGARSQSAKHENTKTTPSPDFGNTPLFGRTNTKQTPSSQTTALDHHPPFLFQARPQVTPRASPRTISKPLSNSPSKPIINNDHMVKDVSEKFRKARLEENDIDETIEEDIENLPYSPMKISPIKSIPASPQTTNKLGPLMPMENLTNYAPMEDEWGEEGY